MGLHYAGIKRGNAGRETRPISCLTQRTNGVEVSRFANAQNVVNRHNKQRTGARVDGSRAGGIAPSRLLQQHTPHTHKQPTQTPHTLAGGNTLNRKQPPLGGR
jgi:hypothetical protein